MYEQITTIVQFIADSFLHIWPYLLITIALAVAVRMSGASKYINRAFQAQPILAIFLATAVGAFSPFCSCGVIPVIAALLLSGVPLAPVMSFWIASPSMDPEILFLSVSAIGWELAVWRLSGALAISLSAGLLTHLIVRRGWLGEDLIRRGRTSQVPTTRTLVRGGWLTLRRSLHRWSSLRLVVGQPVMAAEVACCDTPSSVNVSTGSDWRLDAVAARPEPCQIGGCDTLEGNSCTRDAPPFRRRLLKETWEAAFLVTRFMALAFFLEALIMLYVPEKWIAGLLGYSNPGAVLTAAFLGIPVYTSNLAALPVVSGLLEQGMMPAAGLAFLVAGPTTTLPAMAAVWGLASRRVFALYVSFSLFGAVILGYLYGFMT
jgi:uncharacterized membrane protein YraQ (UPF0718 family)